MLIPDDPWRSPARYSLATFTRRLAEANPAVLAERPAAEYYAKCETYGVDAALLCEQFFHESGGGKEGVARTTKSWGNTGYPYFGPPPLPANRDVLGLDDKRFPSYATWLDGLESTLARLTATNWVYHDRHSIAELFDHPSGSVWAPAGHHNDPSAYLWTLITQVGKRSDQPGARTVPRLPHVKEWIVSPTRKEVRPGLPLRAVKKITVHETDNTDDGADAEMHAKLLATNPGWKNASWHYTVDDIEVIHHIPLAEVAWHAGDKDGPGNFESLAVEHCVNADGNFWVMRRNGAGLVAQLVKNFSLSLGDVVQHNHWARVGYQPVHKDCPQIMRHEGLWDSYLELVARSLAPAVTEPQVTWRFYRTDGERGHYVNGGFRAFYDSTPDAQFVFGLPLSEEFSGTDGVTRQCFQKVVFEHRPDWGPWNSWHVYLMNGVQDGISATALAAAYPEAFAPKEGPK